MEANYNSIILSNCILPCLALAVKGGAAVLSEVHFFLLRGERGIPEASPIEALIRPPHYHFPTTELICFQSRHNRGCSSFCPAKKIEELSLLIKTKALVLHFDEARLWNVCGATGLSRWGMLNGPIRSRSASQRNWELQSVLWIDCKQQ